MRRGEVGPKGPWGGRVGIALALFVGAGLVAPPAIGGLFEFLGLKKRQRVVLELDFFTEELPLLEEEDLHHWYKPVGLNVDVISEKNSLETFDGECASKAYVDELLDQTKTAEVPYGDWHVHGLVLPYDCVELFDDDELLNKNYKYLGMLWLVNDDDDGTGNRESFIILDKNFDNSEGSLDQRKYTIAHEMAHVLNAHHCEFDLDGWNTFDGEFGDWSEKHFRRKKKNPEEVMPGGLGWCETSDFHETVIHQPNNCAPGCDESEGQAYDGTEVALAITPEKEHYLPGEPIHVDVKFVASKQLAEPLYYMPGSLKRSSPFLSFKVGENASTLEPLGRPTLGYRPRTLAPLKKGMKLRGEGLDVWYGLPQEWTRWNVGQEAEKSLTIQASYTIFAPPDADGSCKGNLAARCRRVRVVSAPVEIKIGVKHAKPGEFSPEAYRAFTAPSTRRFLWLGGSDRHETAKDNLDKIVGGHKNTLYARYANVALGLDISSQRRSRPLRTPGEREAVTETLKKLKGEQLNKLPPSYRRLLDRRIRRIEKRPPVPPGPTPQPDR